MSKNPKVIVGLSGGVDSSVSAYLLKQQGYEVEGLFMKNWEEDDTDSYCAAAEDLKDVESVCERIGIPYHTVNFAAEYWDNVFEYFLQEYQAGRTPNPDILCNREIKFKAFLDHALDLGADYIATGHYVRKRTTDSGHYLLTGLDNNKDQSYFLYTLTQNALAKSLFPVGGLEKHEVRQIAKEANLITHAKKDSTGICFIGERRFKTFLSEYLPANPGEIHTTEGQCIGRHDGLMYYTLGQRQGLGIGGTKNSNGKPWYVVDKDLDANVLIVAQGADHPMLYATTLTAIEPHWINDKKTAKHCQAKTRYRQKAEDCQVFINDDGHLQVKFTSPQFAITPGQAVVFYDRETCLGGATIDTIIK